jgi:hypothetical protein
MRTTYEDKTYCQPCYNDTTFKKVGIDPKDMERIKNIPLTVQTSGVHEAFFNGEHFNEPAHYHQHEIDTIEFLQRGFPPQVFMGFAIGHVVKYAQRAEYKNGREDFVKMVDYSKRALEWYDKTHS